MAETQESVEPRLAGARFIGAEAYSVGFTQVRVGDDIQFVPKYARHRPAARLTRKGRVYEPATHDLIRRYCAEVEGSIIHAGAFFGDMLPSFSRSVRGTVYAFEPVLENYVLARLCVDRNGLENVVLQNAALSARMCSVRMDAAGEDGKHAGGAAKVADQGRLCPAISIDALGIDDLILLQLDIEGHELSALRGAAQTIARRRPVIAIEDIARVCGPFLAGAGYEKVGAIPGLGLWVHAEDAAARARIDAILAGTA